MLSKVMKSERLNGNLMMQHIIKCKDINKNYIHFIATSRVRANNISLDYLRS